MAGLVVALLVALAAVPDDVASVPTGSSRGTVSMKAAPVSLPGSPTAVASLSSSEAEVPPGDGRDLGPELPTVTRLSVSAGFSAAFAELPPPAGKALPERPPKAG